MSIRAMLTGLVTHLREQLSLDDDECDVQPDARPPAIMGEKYIAICEDGITAQGTRGQGASTLTKYYQFRISVTRRTGQYGRDRSKKIYLENIDGIDQLATEIIAQVHGSYDLMNLANQELSGLVKFTLPLWFVGQEPTRLEAADWAGPVSESDSSTYIVSVLRFAGAMRVQTIGLAH